VLRSLLVSSSALLIRRRSHEKVQQAVVLVNLLRGGDSLKGGSRWALSHNSGLPHPRNLA